MGSGFDETALAIFTTLAPMGAAAFIVLAVAFWTEDFEEAVAARIDKWTALPLLVTVIGFVASFFHLASPLHALGVFAGLGRSPLSNEVFVGTIVVIAMVVYWAIALSGKMTPHVRKPFSLTLAVLAIVFAIVSALAYMIETIPTWNQPSTLLQMLGFALLGGAILGSLVLACAHAVPKGRYRVISFVIAIVGALLGVAGFAIQIGSLSSIANSWSTASALVPSISSIGILLALCAVIALVLQFFGGKKNLSPAMLSAAFVVAAVGVFFARIAFYGLRMTVGL